MSEPTKACTRCGVVKPLEEFSRRAASRDGRRSWCKGCCRWSWREYGGRNRERLAERQRLYYAEHLEMYRALDRRYKQKNKSYVLRNRARKHRLQGYTNADHGYVAILRSDPCSYCGAGSGTIDHIDALAVGGEIGWTNLTACCRSCNPAKKANSLLLFLLRKREGEDSR